MVETVPTGTNSPNVQLHQVGKPLIRKDAPNKAYGNTLYAGDLTMPGMLYAKVFRADRAECVDRQGGRHKSPGS